LIVTPFGGTALGEFAYHLGNYLNSEPAPALSRAPLASLAGGGARDVLGGPRTLHDAIDQPPPPPRVASDNLGLSSAYTHRFRILFGQETVQDERGKVDGVIAFHGSFELVAIPGFLRPGRFQRWFSNGNFTHWEARLGYAPGSRDADLDFGSHLFGWYSQNFETGPNGGRGYAHEVAFSTSVHFLNQRLAGHDDQFGIVHLLSPLEQVWMRSGPVKLRFGVDFSPDFASLHSAAYELFVQRFGREGTKSSLHRHGYFHGWGLSAGASTALDIDAFEFGARARYGRYESIDGAERVQEEVTREPHGRETVSELAAHVAFEPPGTPLSAELELARIGRESALGWLNASRAIRKASITLGVHF
jgi:hypothetical protein